jgi:hypothetical protein
MKILNSIILFIVAVVLAAALFPIGFIYALIHAIGQLRYNAFSAFLSNFLYSLALGIDKIGNVACGALFNATLIKGKSTYKFGNINDTVSYVLARNLQVTIITFPFNNKQTKQLTWAGWWLVCILELIDPDHMAKTRKRKY